MDNEPRFKIGDKVRVRGKVATVVQLDSVDGYESYVQVRHEDGTQFWYDDTQVSPAPKFKVGDYVKTADGNGTVSYLNVIEDWVVVDLDNGNTYWYRKDHIEHAPKLIFGYNVPFDPCYLNNGDTLTMNYTVDLGTPTKTARDLEVEKRNLLSKIEELDQQLEDLKQDCGHWWDEPREEKTYNLWSRKCTTCNFIQYTSKTKVVPIFEGDE